MGIEAVGEGGSNLPPFWEEDHLFRVLFYKIKAIKTFKDSFGLKLNNDFEFISMVNYQKYLVIKYRKKLLLIK